jgi:hypothetical protein
VVFGLGVCAVARVAPVPFHAIHGPAPGTHEPSLTAGIAAGVLAHALAVLTAAGLGALASRAVTREIRIGVTVLVAGVVLAVVLGLRDSVAPWLVPPVMAMARDLNGDLLPSTATFALLAAWAVAWTAVVLTCYGWLRHRRA